jgi:preprotein translocase subunit SecA
VNYVVNGDEVVIVDEFTGRLMPGRNWSDGLHQAVEAKEAGRGARIKEENQTLATITLQNFFKLYDKICGMTGTAMTEAAEFWKIYKLDVIAIPTNKALKRLNNPDVIYRSEREKYNAIVEEIEQMNKYDALTNKKGEEFLGQIVREDENSVEFQPQGFKETEVIGREKIKEIERRGRPILVGTVSIEKSETISRLLEQRGVPHEVLNAKHHQREAEIVAQAGRKSAVTIATNMAGRGTDIILGGNPEAMAWAQLKDKYPTRLEVPHDEWDRLVQEIEQREQMKAEGRDVAAMGGLHIIGTERHEARRIDLQLRGRCGRQGDPGSSRFYLSLEDDLMRIFAGEWVKNILTRLGMKEGEAIISHMVSRRVEGAQKKVEERNFEIRKNLLEYDEVMDEQRKRVYRYRQNILDGARCKDLILEMIDQQVDHYLDQFLGKDYGTASFAEWAGARLAVELDAKDFRGMDFEQARQYAINHADRMVESQVIDALDENLPEEEETGEWNWEALTKTANTRWKLSLRDRDLRQLGRDGVGEFLIEKAREAVAKTELDDGVRFLEPDFGARTACNWVRQKFGIDVSAEFARGQEAEAFKDFVKEKAREAYDQREMEYPIQAGMTHFSARDATGHKHFDRDKLAEWAARRFETTLSVDNLKNKQRDEIHAQLVRLSRDYALGYASALEEAVAWRQKIFPDDMPADQAFRLAQEKGLLAELSQWLYKKYGYEWSPEEMRHLSPEQFERQLGVAVEEKYRPEMRRMERALVLQILDEAWKNHLLVMDHLRSSVGLRGYAQVDPKVEYKREGMATFEEMWASVGQRVTDLVFKIEELDEGFVGSTWSEGEAVHEEASGTDIAEQQEAAIEGTEADRKPEPIRHKGPRVGRNDPCPCGSGKKFKNCCMKKGGAAA